MRECEFCLEVRCSPERFWPLYFDEGFNRDTFVEGLRWDEPTITEFRVEPESIVRTIAAHPKVEVGGSVAKLIGEKLGYQEWGRFDRRSGEFAFRHRTNIFADKLWIRGKMWAEPLGVDRMHWRTKLTIECTVLAVGGLLERAVEHNVVKAWPQCSNYWNRWLSEHPDRTGEISPAEPNLKRS